MLLCFETRPRKCQFLHFLPLEDRALSKELKVRLMRLLVWPVATYGCETWTLKASDRKRISAFEMTSYRRMLRISWKEHRTNQSILEEIGEETRLLKDIQ